MKKAILVLLLIVLLCAACDDVEDEKGLFDKLFEDSLNHWPNEDDGETAIPPSSLDVPILC